MQTQIKHSKYRNSGILFELLVRQVTSDLMSSKDSKAIGILKKYFTASQLAEELSLYNILLSAKDLPQSKAEILINTVCEQSKKLNREKLGREKYNLIKEIKKHYDLESFFKAKVKNYKVSAAVYTLLESNYVDGVVNATQLVNNRITVLEHITPNPVNLLEEDSEVSEFLKEDKEIKILGYKILVERFNEKYSTLSAEQKDLLKEYINNISDTVQLKNYLNRKLTEVRKTLTSLIARVDNPVTKIKLTEVVKYIQPLPSNSRIKDEHLVSLMQYYELVKELKNTVGK